jgi:hypothetical protein
VFVIEVGLWGFQAVVLSLIPARVVVLAGELKPV